MSVRLFVTAQEVTGTTGKSDIDDLYLLLLEEVKLKEVGEELAERSDLGSEAQLSKLIFSLNQCLSFVCDEGGVEGTCAQLHNLVENQVVAQ